MKLILAFALCLVAQSFANSDANIDFCDDVHTAFCMLKEGNVDGALNKICWVVDHYVPSAKPICDEIKKDVDKYEPLLEMLIKGVAEAAGCDMPPCHPDEAETAAEKGEGAEEKEPAADSGKAVCEACHIAECLLQEGEIDKAEKEICGMVDEFFPQAKHVCDTIVKDTEEYEPTVKTVIGVISTVARCPTVPCKTNTAVADPEEKLEAIPPKACKLMGEFYCLVQSGDVEAVESTICNAVEEFDPKIRDEVKMVCNKVEKGTLDSLEGVESILKLAMDVGGCGKGYPPKCSSSN